MGYLTSLLLLTATLQITLCADDELCPLSSVISPCTCDGEGINCMKARTDSELQSIFRSIPKPWKFRAVWIQITDMTILPTNMFQGIQIQAFHIEVNKIAHIQEGAFRGSEQTAYSISVFGNQIIMFPFEDMKKFMYLQSFNAGRNRLTSIPQNAFYGHKYLKQILLPENLIAYIGPNAFNGIPNLERLDLLHNRLSVLGPFSLAMSSQNPNLAVNLANNTIVNIVPNAFQGMTPATLLLPLNSLQYLEEAAFLPMIRKMAQNGGIIDLSANPLSCSGCNYRWMVMNKQILLRMLYGFRCVDGRDLQMLTLWNINCPLNSQTKTIFS